MRILRGLVVNNSVPLDRHEQKEVHFNILGRRPLEKAREKHFPDSDVMVHYCVFSKNRCIHSKQRKSSLKEELGQSSTVQIQDECASSSVCLTVKSKH